MLTILLACERLHLYIFGREVTVHTDDRPLQHIFQKPISLAPPRLQRMLLWLRRYDVKVKYVASKSVSLADTLSRLIEPGTDTNIPGLNVQIAQVLEIRQKKLATMQEETMADPFLQMLKSLIQSGWPESMQDLPNEVKPCWCFKDELSITDGLIMKGTRVIIPSSMRSESLTRLHDGHQGTSSTLQRARRTMYWPNMQNDITEMIRHCEECQIHGNKKIHPP